MSTSPPPGGQQMPPPSRPAATANDSAAKKTRMWQIATIVLAVTTVAGLVWGFMATKNANDQAAANQQQIDQLKAQMASEETNASAYLKADAEKIRQFEATGKSLKSSLKIDTKDLKAESEKIKTLNQQYQQEKTAAAAEDATLQDKLNAAESRAELAEHCSAVMASGLTKIYEDVPSIVTYKEVAAVLNTVAANCQGIANLPTP